MQSTKQQVQLHKNFLIQNQKIDESHFVQIQNIARAIAVFVFGALCASGSIYDTLAPFAFALALGLSQKDAVFATIGSLVYVVLVQGGGEAVSTASALVAILAVRWVLPRAFALAAAVFVLVLFAATLSYVWVGALSFSSVFLAVGNAILAVTLGWTFANYPPGQEKLGTLALGAIFVVCLAGFTAPFFWVSVIFISAVGAVLCQKGEQKQALICAIIFSVAVSMGNNDLIFTIAGASVSAVVSVWFGEGSKLRVAMLYLAGSLVSAFSVSALAISWIERGSNFQFLLYPFLYVGSVACGIFVFLLVPKSFLENEKYAIEQIRANLNQNNSAAATRLGALAESLEDIADTVRNVHDVIPRKSESFNWVIDNMQNSLCSNCTKKAECYGKRYGETIGALFALKPKLEQSERVGVENFPFELSHCIHPAALASEMTRAYTIYKSACQSRVHSETLRAALTEQYGAVAQALVGLSSQLGEVGLPEHYKTRRVAQLFKELGMEAIECAVTQETLGRLRATITLPRTGFSQDELDGLCDEVSRVCCRDMEFPQKLSCRGVTTLIFNEKAVLRPVFGMAKKAAKGDISGDAVQQFCRVNSAEMILCDGMGTGEPAAVDGMLAAELTARLLKVGFTAETAARLVNIALTLKGEDESSATLDLISVDLYTGTTNLFKAGAVPTFIVQGGKAKTVGQVSLPVGILGEVMGESLSLRMKAGDIAVLVSDGMLLDGSEWILQQLELSHASGQMPEEIASLLVKTATMRAKERTKADDITAAVLKLEKV